MSDTIKVRPGKELYTYSEDEVVWLHDPEHTPYNKRSGEVDSVLKVEIRAPGKADWVSFTATETTTTRNYSGGKDTTRDRVVRFNISRDQFAAIAAHIAQTKAEAEAHAAAVKDHQ